MRAEDHREILLDAFAEAFAEWSDSSMLADIAVGLLYRSRLRESVLSLIPQNPEVGQS